VPQIRPLADTVHSKHLFTYLFKTVSDALISHGSVRVCFVPLELAAEQRQLKGSVQIPDKSSYMFLAINHGNELVSLRSTIYVNMEAFR